MKKTEKDCFPEIDAEASKREDAIVRTLALTFTGVMKALVERYGEEVIEVARKGFLDAKLEPDKVAFQNIEDKTVENYCTWLNSILMLSHTFELSVNEEKTDFQYEFHTCPWAKYFREFGGEKFGQFFCDADPLMVQAYSEDLGFEVSKLLMRGDDCCNHHFFAKTKNE